MSGAGHSQHTSVIAALHALAAPGAAADPACWHALAEAARAVERASLFGQGFFFTRYYWYAAGRAVLPGPVEAALLAALRGQRGDAAFLDGMGILYRFASEIPDDLLDRLAALARAAPLDAPPGGLWDGLITLYFMHRLKAVSALADACMASPAALLRLTHAMGSVARVSLADISVMACYIPIRRRIHHDEPATDDPDHLAAAVARAATLLGPDQVRSRLIHRSLLAALTGDPLGGAHLLAEAAAAPGTPIFAFRAVDQMVPLADLGTVQTRADAPPRGWCGRADGLPHMQLTHDPAGEVPLLVAADQAYYDRFMAGFLESVGVQAPGQLVHCHLIDATTGADEVAALADRARVRVNITWDTPPRSVRASQDLYRGYAAAARFLYLPHLLGLYDGVVTSDVDGVVLYPPAAVLADHGADVVLRSSWLKPAPTSYPALWASVSAGHAGFRANAPARACARLLARLLWDGLDRAVTRGARFFFADQLAMALAYLHHRGQCRFAYLDRLLFSQSADIGLKGREAGKQAAQARAVQIVKRRKADRRDGNAQ
ncbi:hypothetical protein [Yunchengibacter salinarum]|uniref:hypothetical protein n=1 Tax=Yunchengibacter salinarum TaxID=3133399 RepID=UPI0035B5C21E